MKTARGGHPAHLVQGFVHAVIAIFDAAHKVAVGMLPWLPQELEALARDELNLSSSLSRQTAGVWQREPASLAGDLTSIADSDGLWAAFESCTTVP